MKKDLGRGIKLLSTVFLIGCLIGGLNLIIPYQQKVDDVVLSTLHQKEKTKLFEEIYIPTDQINIEESLLDIGEKVKPNSNDQVAQDDLKNEENIENNQLELVKVNNETNGNQSNNFKSRTLLSSKIPSVIWETAHDRESLTFEHVMIHYHSINLDGNIEQDKILVVILELLDSLAQFLESNKIEYWLSKGTLLGSYRNQSIIPWDSDADIGITFDEYNKLIKVLSNSENVKLKCENCAFVVRKGPNSDVIPIKFFHTLHGLYVDIFLYFQSKVLHGERSYPGYVNRWENGCWACNDEFQVLNVTLFPLVNCKLNERIYKCPHNTEDYLVSWYSPDLSPQRM